jgi:hypothetical protein
LIAARWKEDGPEVGYHTSFEADSLLAASGGHESDRRTDMGMTKVILALGMVLVGCAAYAAPEASAPGQLPWMESAIKRLEADLSPSLNEEGGERLLQGMRQVASLWNDDDGDEAAFEAFVRRSFASDQEAQDALFERFETLLEQIDGHMLEILVELRRQTDLDLGPIYPFDETFAGYDPSAHVSDDLFANKLAFIVLLNFPVTTLEDRLSQGPEWTRRQWAEARLAQRFSRRVPAAVNLANAQAQSRADQYIAEYNIWMHHLLNAEGERLFPPGMKLLSHWNLRDELKANYAVEDKGLEKQRMIQRVMERIVDQTIPQQVVNNPHVDWDPFSNEVTRAGVQDSAEPPPENLVPSSAREPDTRYDVLLGTFLAARQIDPYSPAAPTHIARRFDENRELPEERVEAMFHQVLSSDLMAEVAELIAERLGRPLEPFDIWYGGFRAQGGESQEELDAIVAERYPTAEAYQADIPRMLRELGFAPQRADELAANIVVEPARGSGHAWGAAMRSAPARLRTRVGINGMDYKGYNIAVHEMGHNVEQTVSLNDMDYTLLEGVPNTAFTEAVAFVFQARDLKLLGRAPEGNQEGTRALAILDDFWGTAEISSVALVDMKVWHWLYDHPDSTPGELREATLDIAREVWNRYWAPVIGAEDSILLGIYSHMIHSLLYLPDYPIGHMISVQVEHRIEEAGTVGPEIDRMCRIGSVVPDLWMEEATGSPVGAEALLAATRKALELVRD